MGSWSAILCPDMCDSGIVSPNAKVRIVHTKVFKKALGLHQLKPTSGLAMATLNRYIVVVNEGEERSGCRYGFRSVGFGKPPPQLLPRQPSVGRPASKCRRSNSVGPRSAPSLQWYTRERVRTCKGKGVLRLAF